jgi:hypothetical protein
MPVTIMLHLFAKPGQELNEGEEVTPDQLRALGQSLQERLTEAGDIVEKLTGTGWEAQMALYDVILSHPYFHTEAQVAEKLTELGIDPESVFIDEWEDEEEEFLEEGEEGLGEEFGGDEEFEEDEEGGGLSKA